MHFLDRISSKRVIIGADLTRAILLGVLVLSTKLTMPLIITIQAICCIAGIFFNAAREDCFSEKLNCLGENSKSYFLAIDNQVMRVMEVAGYGLAFLVIGGFGYRTSYAVDAASFILSALILSFIANSLKQDCGKGILQFKSGISAGIHAVSNSNVLKSSTIVRSITWIGGGIFNIGLLKIASERTPNIDPASVSALWQGALTLGMILGLELAKRNSYSINLFGFCGFGNIIVSVSTMIFAAVTDFRFGLSVMFVYGIGLGINSFGMRNIRLSNTDKSVFARVVAFTNMTAKVAEIFGMMFVITLGNLLTSATLLAISGAIIGVAGVLALHESFKSKTTLAQ